MAAESGIDGGESARLLALDMFTTIRTLHTSHSSHKCRKFRSKTLAWYITRISLIPPIRDQDHHYAINAAIFNVCFRLAAISAAFSFGARTFQTPSYPSDYLVL